VSRSPVTVLVADPHPVVRDGLPLLLRDESLLVVATTGVPSAVEVLAARHDPDVVLVSTRLPDPGASAVLTNLLRSGSRAAVVLYVEGEESEQVQNALRAGAAGVVSTSRPVAQVARALRAVASGRTWFNERDWIDAPLSRAAEQSILRADGLSDAEKRVLALVAAGIKTDDIASGLGVSPHTVRSHVRNLMRKLDAQSRAHAVAIAMRESAIDP
jgi:DNA-binding NarL/FixJ family response regulator